MTNTSIFCAKKINEIKVDYSANESDLQMSKQTIKIN